MKVLLTTDTLGGVWTYSLHLMEALAKHGVQFCLCSAGRGPTAAQRAAVAKLRNVHLLESDYRLEWMDEPWEDVAKTRHWLQQVAKHQRPDVIHFNDYSHAAADWPVPVIVVGHSCVLSWYEAVRGAAADATWDRYRAAVTAGIQAAEVVVAPSQAMLRALDQHYGPLGDGRVIYNGRDRPPADLAESKQRQVLSAGRLWDEAKNVAAVIRAAKQLDCPVYVAGDTADPQGRTAEIPATLRCLGTLSSEELSQHYARSAIYALPARYEPFGYTPLEAALHRCALVLGDLPSLREIWGEAAVYVPPENDAALASAIKQLLDHPTQLARLAGAAHQRALRFTSKAMATAYLQLYRQLMTKQPGSQRRGQACVL